MSAVDSSSSRPEALVVTASISLDGVLLECSEEATSLCDLIELPFDQLVITLCPQLVGTAAPPTVLQRSHSLKLVDHRQVGDDLELIYQRVQET